jgi:hypothetical protein
MSREELDAFLATERTCRVATASPDGPHVTPLWFVWDGKALWLSSIVGSQRWTDLQRDPRVAVVVDAGESYAALRGAELRGPVEVVGEVPGSGQPLPELTPIERMFADKYSPSEDLVPDGRHAWLRLVPHTILSWGFRKL